MKKLSILIFILFLPILTACSTEDKGNIVKDEELIKETIYEIKSEDLKKAEQIDLTINKPKKINEIAGINLYDIGIEKREGEKISLLDFAKKDNILFLHIGYTKDVGMKIETQKIYQYNIDTKSLEMIYDTAGEIIYVNSIYDLKLDGDYLYWIEDIGMEVTQMLIKKYDIEKKEIVLMEELEIEENSDINFFDISGNYISYFMDDDLKIFNKESKSFNEKIKNVNIEIENRLDEIKVVDNKYINYFNKDENGQYIFKKDLNNGDIEKLILPKDIEIRKISTNENYFLFTYAKNEGEDELYIYNKIDKTMKKISEKEEDGFAYEISYLLKDNLLYIFEQKYNRFTKLNLESNEIIEYENIEGLFYGFKNIDGNIMSDNLDTDNEIERIYLFD